MKEEKKKEILEKMEKNPVKTEADRVAIAYFKAGIL